MKSTAAGVQNVFKSSMKSVASAIGVAFSVGAVVNWGKKCVQTASETTSAWQGLSSILNGQGKSFSTANKFIQNYISDGLVPLTNAVTAYKNLAARGYDTSQIEQTLTSLKDAAAFGRQASYSYGDAIQSATEGLKNENSILVDNAGVTKNVAKMWEDYAKSIGTTASALTQQQKIQAEVNGIMQETKWQTGDAAKYAANFAGSISKTSALVVKLKTAIGNMLIPVLNQFLPVIQTALQAAIRFCESMQAVMASLGWEMPDVSSLSTSLSDVSSAAVDTASNILDTGKAAETAAKMAKNAFASYDEINVLNTSTATNTASSGSAVSTAPSVGVSDAVNQASNSLDNKLIAKLDTLKAKLNSFWDGFSAGFKTEIDALKVNLDNMKLNFSNAWQDLKTLGSPIKNWADTDLKNYFSTFAKTALNTFNGLWDSANLVFSSLWDTVVFPCFKNFITVGLPIITQFQTELTNLWSTAFNSIKTIFDTVWTDGIVPALGLITGVFTDVMTILKEKWDTYGKPIFDGFGKAITNTKDLLLQVWEQYIKPIWDTVMVTIDEIWTAHLKPLVDNVAELVAEFILCAQNIYNNAIKPVVSFLLDVLAPAFEQSFNTIKNVVQPIIAGVIDTLGNIVTVAKGIIQFISGVFSGDWQKAWTGIKNIFKGIWDTLVTAVKTPLNLLIGLLESLVNGGISAVNTMIRGLNYIPNVNIRELNKVNIPRLAQGGWVAANNPRLAIIGDNTREGEIVTPESKIREQVELALAKFGNTVQRVKLELEILIRYPDGRTIIKKINEAQIAEGRILLEI